MKSFKLALRTSALSLLTFGSLAHAATISGTVIDKTTGKPAAGDSIVLVDVQAGMGEISHATTDSQGHYSLNEPGSGPYLVRVTHQGAAYFIASPPGGGPGGDIPVYDVAAKVQGVFIEADVLEVESDNGQLKVTERYFVHNTSSPPMTEWSAHSFEIVLPPEAVVNGVAAQRPTGLPTSVKMDPDGPRGHYSFNFPIQPDEADKDTLFQLSYNLPYTGKFTFKPQVLLPADNLAVILPKSMTFTGGAGTAFNPVPEDPSVQTFVAKNAVPGKPVEFTVSGNGAIPREQQGAAAGQQPVMGGQNGGGSPDAGSDTSTPGNQPGGGIGNPIGTPDPLSKYKWWIFGGLALLLAAGAAFLLRKPAGAPGEVPVSNAGPGAYPVFASPAAKNTALLNALKEELFALESDKISGTITPEDYAEVKAALETVLKRALSKKS